MASGETPTGASGQQRDPLLGDDTAAAARGHALPISGTQGSAPEPGPGEGSSVGGHPLMAMADIKDPLRKAATREESSLGKSAEGQADDASIADRTAGSFLTPQTPRKGRAHISFHDEVCVSVEGQEEASIPSQMASVPSRISVGGGLRPRRNSSQASILDRVKRLDTTELEAVGRKHMRQTAVTVLDKETGKYRFLPLEAPLDFLGLGVQLHFRFLEELKKVWWVMLLLIFPCLLLNFMGGMIPTLNIARFSIGNLGHCGGAGCQTVDDLVNRTLFNSNRCAELCSAAPCEWACDLQVKDIAVFYGILDGIGVLAFLVFVWRFRTRVIPEVAGEVETALVTPANYSIQVSGIPEFLPEGNTDYDMALKDHFEKVLRRLDEGAVKDETAVHDVVLVHNYHGAILNFNQKGKLMQDRDNHEVLFAKALLAGNEKEVKKQKDQIATIDQKVAKIERGLKGQLSKEDDERPVLMAFITFSQEEYKEKLVAEYRFSMNPLTRCFQAKKLRFQERILKVKEAPEPSDLFWENLDFPRGTRSRRQAIFGFLTILVLGVCGGALAELKGRTLANPAPQTTTWVVKAPDDEHDCLSLCNWQLYASESCSLIGSRSEQWNVSQLFTWNSSTADVDRDVLWSSGSCSKPVESARCQNPEAPDWVGIQFAEPRRVQCMRLAQIQNAQAAKLRVFACGRAPSAEEMEDWQPELHCQEMKSVEPQIWGVPAEDNTTLSDELMVEADDECNLFGNITFEAANASRASLGDTQLSTIHDCYCRQVSFQRPTLLLTDDAVYDLCWGVLGGRVGSLSSTGGIVLTGVVVNRILLMMYSTFVHYEHHMSVSERMSSQLTKVFLAQFFNTGILYLFVSVNIENVAGFLRFMLPGLFTGEYFDFRSMWFASEGSTIFLLIFSQVFTSTLLPIVLGATLTPCCRRMGKKSKATIETMNELYTLPQWDIATRTAQRMNIIFCVMLFSGSMPILYVLGIFYCWLAYWTDKMYLLRFSQRPPLYNDDIMQTSCRTLLPLAAFIHLFLSMWTYGNQAILPSGWNDVLKGFWQTFIRVPDDYYNDVRAEYVPGETKGITMRYFWARLLDGARSGASFTTVVFAGFCVYYVFHLLLFSPLRSILRPIIGLLQEWLNEGARITRLEKLKTLKQLIGVEGNERKALSFTEAEQEMKAKGLTTTYHIEHNMAYQTAHKALIHTTAKAALIHRVEQEGLEVVIDNANEILNELDDVNKQLREAQLQLQDFEELCPNPEDLVGVRDVSAELAQCKTRLAARKKVEKQEQRHLKRRATLQSKKAEQKNAGEQQATGAGPPQNSEEPSQFSEMAAAADAEEPSQFSEMAAAADADEASASDASSSAHEPAAGGTGEAADMQRASVSEASNFSNLSASSAAEPEVFWIAATAVQPASSDAHIEVGPNQSSPSRESSPDATKPWKDISF